MLTEIRRDCPNKKDTHWNRIQNGLDMQDALLASIKGSVSHMGVVVSTPFAAMHVAR